MPSLEDGDGERKEGREVQPGGAISDAAQQKGNVKVLRGTWFLERGEGVRHRRSLSRHGSVNHGLDAPLIIVGAPGMDGAVLAAPESRPVY